MEMALEILEYISTEIEIGHKNISFSKSRHLMGVTNKMMCGTMHITQLHLQQENAKGRKHVRVFF